VKRNVTSTSAASFGMGTTRLRYSRGGLIRFGWICEGLGEAADR
jgi:hypothetical protein